VADLAGKCLQLLREVSPKATRIGVLLLKAGPATPHYLEPLPAAAPRIGATLVVQQENQPESLPGAFAAMQQQRAQAVLVQVHPFTFQHRKPIVKLAAQHQLPAVYEAREFVDAGGLMSFGPSLNELMRRAANFVDRILKGDKPAELPVEQPTTFEIVLNQRTAQALGLTIRLSLFAARRRGDSMTGPPKT